jgi:hypothetical protein
MTDILALRTTVRANQAELDAAQAQLNIFRDQLNQLKHVHADPALLAAAQKSVDDQSSIVRADQKILAASTAIYQSAVLADEMHPADPGLPLLLLPVRIETAYLSTNAGTDLVVRVYPDDIHVDSHEPELTAAELAGGTAYWRAVWGAGSNRARLDAAWTALLGQLKPARAAWAVRALLPNVPRPAGETPVDQEQPEPPLATPNSRPGTFNRAARTTLLPERWRIVGLTNEGDEIFYAEGLPIPDSLDVSFAPRKAAGGKNGSPKPDLPFHEGSLWLVDLDKAIAAGMAVRIPLAGDLHIGQLFVLGTSAKTSPDETAARLESALIAHQYTNGLAFLPPGAPTNNTTATRSDWQSAPPIPSPADLDLARADYQPRSRQNAAMAAAAFGVDGTEVLSIAPNGLADQQTDIGAIQDFLWPALGGKALSWIYSTWDVPPGAAPAKGSWTKHIDFPFVTALRAHAAGWVRSRGTLPVMRVGNQPYGLLPALSLDDWTLPAGDPLAPLLAWLRVLRSYWLISIGKFARAPVESDDEEAKAAADSTVVNLLKRLPVSVEVNVRPESDPFRDHIDPKSVGIPVIPGLTLNRQLFLVVPDAGTPPPLPVPVVNENPPGLPDARIGIQEMLRAFQDMLHDGIAVLEFTMSSRDFTEKYQFFAPGSGVTPDLFVCLVFDALTDPLAQTSLDEQEKAADFIQQTAGNQDFALGFDDRVLPFLKAFLARFDALCDVDPNLYETATRETLDVFSHRLDAWITSLAARRLDEMRAAKPSGLVLGAYGWVENLSPRPAVSDQHYIHAPSMAHAATAAVLRAGYDSHGNTGPLAVNLTSRRVRDADWLAAGIRSGQTAGALLGYRFERALQEKGLERLIFTLRRHHPLPMPAPPEGIENEQGSREAIAERNVVDGLALARDIAGVILELKNPLEPGLQPLTPAEEPTVTGLLTELSNVLDAFGDLLLAESVHHLVGGNPLRAGLTADTAGRGEPLPDQFEVAITPRSARALTWTLGALLPADFRAAVKGWNTDRPRAAAEPHADAWAAVMLGNADSWLFSCTLTTDAGAIAVPVTLDSLGLCALDVAVESAGEPSQLERRIVEAVSGGLPPGSTVTVSREPNADRTPGFGELLSLAERVRTALAKATPLAPQHLQGGDSSIVVGIDAADLDARAAALGTSLGTAVDTLQNAFDELDSADGGDDAAVLAAVTGLRAALIGAADHGLPTAWPLSGADSSPASVSALKAQAASLLSAAFPLAGRARPALPGPNAKDSEVSAWLRGVTEYIQEVTGTGVPVIPAYVLPADSFYAAAFDPKNAPVDASPSEMMAWLRRIARVRANAATLHDLLLAAEVLQQGAPPLTAAHVPAEEGARWAALPFPDGAPPAARIALVLSTPATVDPAAGFCGLVFDSWTEQVPGLTHVAGGDRGYEASELTGLAFKVDTPDSEPPQAALLAIAPDPARGWSFDILFDTVKETFELAKMRPVDLGDLYRFGRILPAIHSSPNVDTMLANAARNPGGHP